MPSYREGLPVSSLEAMYCGLPLVTSKIRGLEDIMEEGKTGYMFNPDDWLGFAKGITKLMTDKEKRIKMGGYNQRKAKPFCIQETKKEVMEVIRELEITPKK